MFKFKTSNIKSYKIAFDKIETLEDVVAVLKVLDITFNIDVDNIPPKQEEAIKNGVIIPESVDKSLLN